MDPGRTNGVGVVAKLLAAFAVRIVDVLTRITAT